MGIKIADIEMESMIHDGVEVQTWIHDGVEVYTAGKMVTYMVDSSISYQEKVKRGHSCLSPSTFTPTKNGWTFTGWREDSMASGTVLSEKVMEREPITLYAVFAQTITLSYEGNGETGGSTEQQSANRYYNCGNIYNPVFTISENGFERTYYNFQNWMLGENKYSPGDIITLAESVTLYAVWTASTSHKTVSKQVTTAINNWQGVRTLVQYDAVFSEEPNVTISGDSEQKVLFASKTYALITSTHATGGGTWKVTATAEGEAYDSAEASGIGNVTGTRSISIKNWAGGSAEIEFGKTFKEPPEMNWYAPTPSASAIANDWKISFKDITTTGCTMTWSKSTGSETKTVGWIAEGYV